MPWLQNAPSNVVCLFLIPCLILNLAVRSTSQVFRGTCRVANRSLNIIVYDAWGDLRFESYDSVAACHYSLIVTLPAIVRGLVAEAEFILLAQLLYAVTVCTYPSKLIHTLAGRLDLVLPGEDRDSIDILDSLHFVRPTRRWWWRAPLAHERPRMIFHEVTMTKFRGPAFTEEIKVSACPAHIAPVSYTHLTMPTNREV